MRKIFIDGREENTKIVLNDMEDLQQLCRELDVHTDVEHKVNNLYVIRSIANMGGSQFIANAGRDIDLLRKISEKVEQKGDITLYYVRLEGQEVDV